MENEVAATTSAKSAPETEKDLSAEKNLTLVIYGLMAAAYFLGFTSIVAVIINYVKREDVRGTWLDSHFRWQIRTFWFSLLWGLIGLLTVTFVIGYVVLLGAFIWGIYRIVVGFLALNKGKPMYQGNDAG